MKRAILLSLVIVAGAAYVSYLRWTPPSGLGELQRSQMAVRKATSWRADTRSVLDGNESRSVEEVTCPDDLFQSGQTRYSDGHTASSVKIRYHGEYFYRFNEEPWQKLPQPLDPPPACDVGPVVGGAAIFASNGELKSRGKVTKKKLEEIDEVKCQRWDIEGDYQWPRLDSYSVCIAPDTYLPRQINYPNTTITFSGWNSTVVQPPAP